MHTIKPFLFSVGIHTALIALLLGGLSILYKSKPPIEEKISLKIVLHPTATEQIRPIQPPLVPPKPLLPTPVPKPIQPQVIAPHKTPIIAEIKPTRPTQLSPTPVITTPPVVSKAPVAAPVVSVAKAPPAPPPPEPKQEYKYPHKSQAQSILKENIVCTKNMKRLKLRGTVFLSFDLTPEGEAKRVTVTQSSGNEILDEAVTQQIKTIAPLLPKPAETITFSSFDMEFKGCQ